MTARNGIQILAEWAEQQDAQGNDIGKQAVIDSLAAAATAMEIVLRLAAGEVLTNSRHFDGMCVFCGVQRQPYGRPPFPHTNDCIWLKARALIMQSEEAKA